MGIMRNEISNMADGLDNKSTCNSFKHIYEQLQLMDHVLDLQVDHAIQKTFQQQNQEINFAMQKKSDIRTTLRNL
ncbi:hypothetical protein [Virgibacillus sp. DJP39]|uniref:hypothetical protein n=1 Tax=Virgibacillus sp. DJP39 TaxID=3409790 RepID=UPI003BB51CA0